MDNLGQNICPLFHLLAEFFFITSEMKLIDNHKKLNVWAASKVAELLKTQKIRNFKEIPEVHGIDVEYTASKKSTLNIP